MLWAIDAVGLGLLAALVAYTTEEGTMFSLGKINKTLTALAGAAIAWATIVQQSPSAAITSSEWLAGGILLAGVFGVYQAPNVKPAAPNGGTNLTLGQDQSLTP